MTDHSTDKEPSILSTIGNTPIVEVTRFDTGKCRLFLKLESQNPGGSIKDRVALSMIDAAEKNGDLKPGGTIIEATAGNTGLGLALVGVLKGYKVILVVPDKMAQEKVLHCKALGADVRITRSDVTKGHPAYYQDMARRIAKEENAFFVNQFENKANTLAHETTTGPEIWAQMNHDVDAVVCGVGSGGTMSGLANYLHSVKPDLEMILADPDGSILTPLINEGKEVQPGSWLVEGIGEDFIPDILDLGVVTKGYSISDRDSFAHARELLTREGILAGSSSGTLFATALQYCREQTEARNVVTFVCDRGDKYLSKSFNDFWMTEQGLVAHETTDTVEDLIVRRHDRGDTTTVTPDDTLMTAYGRMRGADVSQLPVVDGAKVLGVVYEKNLFDYVQQNIEDFDMKKTVGDVMTTDFPVIESATSIKDAAQKLQQNFYAIVQKDDQFIGVVTRVDVLNHMILEQAAQ